MALDFEDSNPATGRSALTVSALNRAVSSLLQRSFPLVRVRGEIANMARAASGHCYFALKDSGAQARCVMFRARNQLLDWIPRDGDEVEVTAIVSLYEARGEFQLSIEYMRRAGQGRLFEEYLKLKARLAGEGLFDAARKRMLPRIPRRVAVVTSLHAAALCDVVTTLCRRAPYAGVIIFPAPVQGAGAGAQLARALERVSQRAVKDAIDVVLLVRGGGSIEDLWAFNEEVLARAIVSCPVPVVVGVGHESDVTIADFVADLRAPTPTAAAEMAAPAAADLLAEIQRRIVQLQRMHAQRVAAAAQRLDYAQRALMTPRMPLLALDGRVVTLQSRATAAALRAFEVRHNALATRRERLLRWRPTRVVPRPGEQLATLAQFTARRLNSYSMQLTSLAARLHAIDPHTVLARGYSITLAEDGHAVTDAQALQSGDKLQLVFARGQAEAQVKAVQPSNEHDVVKR